MTYRVVIQPRAQRDILLAADWIENQSKSREKALRWILDLRANIETLKANPYRCPFDTDSETYGEEVRILLHGERSGRYRNLFALRGDTVHILTVRHAARQIIFDPMVEQDEEIEAPDGEAAHE